MEQKKRSSFSSRIGFVLAAAGSAVGLGNLWRFPYLAARYGGGIFLLVYLILALTFGFSLMITEIAIGRKTRLSCIGAYKALDKRFGFLGWLAARSRRTARSTRSSACWPRRCRSSSRRITVLSADGL